MHRGVQDLVRWIDAHRDSSVVQVNPPASAADISALEHQLGVPLPADLRYVLTRFNGGTLPSGQLLPAGMGPGTIEAAVRQFAEAVGADFLDPELLLPFHRTLEGSVLCFDRSAGPVSDTWHIVDYYEDTGETRIVYRTFDGWCRTCVAEWESPDFEADFSLDKYLEQGKRHASIEPDVSTAHATVAHALKRAGKPEEALASYLRAARCVPALPWCDWEALKLAVLLDRPLEALESSQRLASRAPSSKWRERETTPGRVADVLGQMAIRAPENKNWIRVLDQLVEQATDEDDHAQAHAVRYAVLHGEPLPTPRHHRDVPVVEPTSDLEQLFAAAREAYEAGSLRDEDMLLDATLLPLFRAHRPIELLSIRREF
jgi:hypothetical protein